MRNAQVQPAGVRGHHECVRGDPRFDVHQWVSGKEQFHNWTKLGHAGDGVFCGEAQGAGVEDYHQLCGKALGVVVFSMNEMISTAIERVGTRPCTVIEQSWPFRGGSRPHSIPGWMLCSTHTPLVHLMTMYTVTFMLLDSENGTRLTKGWFHTLCLWSSM